MPTLSLKIGQRTGYEALTNHECKSTEAYADMKRIVAYRLIATILKLHTPWAVQPAHRIVPYVSYCTACLNCKNSTVNPIFPWNGMAWHGIAFYCAVLVFRTELDHNVPQGEADVCEYRTPPPPLPSNPYLLPYLYPPPTLPGHRRIARRNEPQPQLTSPYRIVSYNLTSFSIVSYRICTMLFPHIHLTSGAT